MGWFSDKSSTDHVIHLYCQSRGVRRIFVGGGLHWWPKVKNRHGVGRLWITLLEPEAGADPGESKGGGGFLAQGLDERLRCSRRYRA